MTLIAVSLEAQNDTMYIMKNGVIVEKYNVNTQIDSVIFYDPIPTTGIFTDARDNIVYNWVRIGNQTWMAENLKYLPNVVGIDSASLTSPFYYVYGYNGTDTTVAKATSNYNTYGVLYNWPAAMNSCPTGWHLPTDAEWTQLYTTYLGGGDAGRKVKATRLWPSPNDATNESGFSALPAGSYIIYDDYGGMFNYIGYFSDFWSATTEGHPLRAFIREIAFYDSSIGRFCYYKNVGISVRCVKN